MEQIQLHLEIWGWFSGGEEHLAQLPNISYIFIKLKYDIK